MTLGVANALVSVGTVLLVAATALAAFVQLHHLRTGNELTAALAIERDFRRPELQAALAYVASELPTRIEDAEYRSVLSSPGYIDPRRHPEMILCNWFNRTGALVRGGFVKEDVLLDSFGRLVTYYWERLAPVVAVLRRTRGPGQYDGFEYLAYRAQLRAACRPSRHRRRGGARLSVVDPWLEHDARVTAGQGDA